MHQGRFFNRLNKLFYWVLACFPLPLHASFIESTIGTAVVNDATATYYNPAALTLLNNSQIIGLGSLAYLHTEFTGQTVQAGTGFTQSGTTKSDTRFYLPSLYLCMPANDRITVGLAVISNAFNKTLEDNSILRYVQSGNSVDNIDLVSAIGFKINQSLSVGVGLNVSYANFISEPVIGFPTLDIPDSQSRNSSNGIGVGGDVGILLKPAPATLIGFNYRSAVTYKLNGTSLFESDPPVISDQYHFNFWTPARSVLTVGQLVSPVLGFIATLQYIQWNIFKDVDIHEIPTEIGGQPVIFDAKVPFHLHNAWIYTLGSQYRVTSKWIVRIAASYVESPGNNQYQLTNGDSTVIGASMGYDINKYLTMDGSYAHAFIQNEEIHITGGRSYVTGINKGSRDGISLKLTINLDNKISTAT